MCDEDVKINPTKLASRIAEHVQLQRHISNASKKTSQPLNTTTIDNQDKLNEKKQFTEDFRTELLWTFLAADIPVEKLSNVSLKAFLKKWTSQDIPHPTTFFKTYIGNEFDLVIKI